ncbi:FliM/FliN family flagellar motor C-terminal domain-containing protein [uncultured Paracoccus sp.]|uniref:FliM/FliN family flagellar motor C-terminal domain-containing protein n=1 Tax=Paracoccus sp. S1E-3 TaxID=2756130 RepID=UPI001C688F7B|nr:FliM/FliN family flagellar motor C-terminal domain-containing protein [uncultured Paracoccus sp.]
MLGQHLARFRVGLPATQPRVAVPKATPERALATAIGRAAQASCQMPVYPAQAQMTHATLAELGEILPERGLILVVEGPLGALGVVTLCPAMLASVIEMQSLGRLTRQPPRERRATRTDASICADFVNLSLAELAAELSALTPGAAHPVFRFASFVEDPRPLELMLDDIAYRCLRLDMKVGQGGMRDAAMLIFLPDTDAAVARPGECTPGQAAPGAAVPGHVASVPAAGRSLAEAVRAAPVSVNAVLCRRKITLRELRALQAGSVLGLPHDAMATVRLETPSGLEVARGKLGALHGNRAIRIAARAGAKGDAGRLLDVGMEGAASGTACPADRTKGATSDEMSLLADPPLADVDQPDPFRTAFLDSADGSDNAAPAPPLNFMID